jgi:hypothetical protein
VGVGAQNHGCDGARIGLRLCAFLLLACSGEVAGGPAPSSHPGAGGSTSGGAAGVGGAAEPGTGGPVGTAGTGKMDGTVGASGAGGVSGAGGAPFPTDTTAPPELGKPCAFADDCGVRAGCDAATAKCVWPCAVFGSSTRTVPCASGQNCAPQGPYQPSVCYTPCSPAGTCPAGLACVNDEYAGLACVRAGTATLGMPCTKTKISSGCASGLTCVSGACGVACAAAASKCPSGEQCLLPRTPFDPAGVCIGGDAAALGERCSSADGRCAGDGAAWNGVCDAQRVCVHPCDGDDQCAPGQRCVDMACHAACDPLATDPGCHAPEQCHAVSLGLVDGAVCTATASSDSAGLREPCSVEHAGCASDGEAFRGACVTWVRVARCWPYCAERSDCANGEDCISGICQPETCDVLAPDPGCTSPAVCSAWLCTDVGGYDVSIGESCPDGGSDSFGRQCANDGKAWRGICSYTAGAYVCRRRCDASHPCAAHEYCDREACVPDG